jgi:6-pyruvoyltetrahydropterin/6-carboxytetrahydropterin synthase
VYELKVVTQMAAAHQLREFSGKCENLHGHNWKIEIYVTGQELGPNGILIDFKLVKDSATKIIQDLDHTFLNDLKPFEEINPSSENIARFVFSSLSREINTDHIKVSKVTAWESDSACATYMEP